MDERIRARIELLHALLVQAGKRLSADTITKLNAIMKAMQDLMGQEDADETLVEQAWVGAPKVLLQQAISGESMGESYENLIGRVGNALRSDGSLDGSYRYVVSTMPDWVVFCAESYNGERYEYEYFRADWEEDAAGIHFSNVEKVTIEQVVVAITDAAASDSGTIAQAKKGDYGTASEAGYADPGYQSDKKPRYPLKENGKLSEERIRAAWSYINQKDNAAKYSAGQVAKIKGRIKAAAKAVGIKIAAQSDRTYGTDRTYAETGSIRLLQQKSANGRPMVAGIATMTDTPVYCENLAVEETDHKPTVFPSEVRATQLQQKQQEIADGKALGCLGHPELDHDREPTFQDYCLRYTSLLQQGNTWPFEAEVLQTSAGRELEGLLASDVALDMSAVDCGAFKTAEWDGQPANVVQAKGFHWKRIADVVLHGAAPGSAITSTWLQALNAEPGEEHVMDPEEIKRLIEQVAQQVVASGNAELMGKLQALEAKVEESQGKTVELSEEDKALLGQAKVVVDESNAQKILQARDAKIKETVEAIPAEEMPEQFRSTMTGLLQNSCASADDVEKKLPGVKEAMKPFLAQAATFQSQGFYFKEHNDDGTTKAKIETPAQAIDDVMTSAVERGTLPKDTGVDNPGNTYRNVKVMLQTMATEHPEYAEAYAAMRNRAVKTPQQMRDLLQQKFGIITQAGEMKTTDVADAIPYLMGIVTDLVPQLIATRYASVQPMTRSKGTIATWKIEDQDGNDIEAVANFTGSYGIDPGEKETIKKLKGGLTTYDVTPTAKKLAYDMSVEVMRRLQTDWGMDATSIMVTECAAEIAREWNYNHLQSMVTGATAGNWTYGKAIPVNSSFDGEQWQKQLINYIQTVRAGIFKKTFAPTVAILGDADAIARILWLSKQVGSEGAPGQGIIARGVDIVGSLATGEELVSVGWWESLGLANKLLVIGRGAEWYRTGFVIAPYLGLYVSPVWVEPTTLDVQQGMLSEVAEKMVNGNYFGTITMTSAAGTPL